MKFRLLHLRLRRLLARGGPTSARRKLDSGTLLAPGSRPDTSRPSALSHGPSTAELLLLPLLLPLLPLLTTSRLASLVVAVFLFWRKKRKRRENGRLCRCFKTIAKPLRFFQCRFRCNFTCQKVDEGKKQTRRREKDDEEEAGE